MRLLIALLLALLAASCDRQKAEAPQAAPEAQPSLAAAAKGRVDRSFRGRDMPDVEFSGPDGEAVSLADFRGEPLLLNLWATWCAPCVAEMPTLDRLAGSRNDVKVLAVSEDFGEQKSAVTAFFRERKLERLEPYQDAELALMEKLDAAVLPTTILYDAEGHEIWRVVGALDWTGPEAERLLDEAVRL